ncbi:MAG: 23S rRNA (guanosine(2251)-2'-O)-methyltransferase RlmB [Pseudomonadota bacterium]
MSQETIYGIHAVSQRIMSAPAQCIELVCIESGNQRLQKVIEQARRSNVPTRFTTRQELNDLCGLEKHQNCVLISQADKANLSFTQMLETINSHSLLLILDGVQDPHNLGACLRTADACGVDALIIPADRSAKLSPVVRKVAAGAAETVPLIEVTNLARSLKALKQAGVWIYGTSGDASEDLYQYDYRGPVALVMGAEGSGIRRLTRETCDHLIRLPMRGRVESLNVSVATGICLYEIQRSRGED